MKQYACPLLGILFFCGFWNNSRMRNGTGLLLALLAYTLLSAGLVLMKKGVAWIGFKGSKDKAWRRNLWTWIAGFLVTNLYIVPSAAALKSLEPHVVASAAGWGVAVMVVLSRVLLGERLCRRDVADSAVIMAAIAVLNIFERSAAGSALKAPFLVVAAAAPFLLVIPLFFRGVSPKVRTVLFAAVSGLSAGMIVVTMKVLVTLFEFRVGDYFSSPYFYLYLLFSVTGFAALQFAYKAGEMMLAGPTQYSAAIIYPVVCSVLVLGNRLHPLQPAAILVVALAVVDILRRR